MKELISKIRKDRKLQLIVVVGFALGILVVIGIVWQLNSRNLSEEKAKALESTGYILDYKIEKVIGQINEKETTYNKVVPNRLMHGGGVHVDTSQESDRFYIYDSSNNRILGFRHIGVCGSQDKVVTDFSSEHQQGWATKIFDGRYGICNVFEWATKSETTGYVTFTTDSGKRIRSISIYDRACAEQVLSGQLELSSGEIFNFGELADSGGIPTEVIINRENISWVKLSITSSTGGQHVGIGEVEINYDSSVEGIQCSTSSDCLDGQTCQPVEDREADLVFGQESGWDYGACNRNDTIIASPTQDTLCLAVGNFVKSKAEAPRFGTMDTDSQGNLYVLDQNNNRILRYNNPFGSLTQGAGDAIADHVWGQPDFNSKACNRGQDNPSDNTLCSGVGYVYPGHFFGGGVDIDSQGNLWVTDSANHRILRFPNSEGIPAQNADLVLGQDDFQGRESDCSENNGLNKLCKPNTVRVKDSTQEVYVVDGQEESARILVYSPPFTNGAIPVKEIGRGITPQTGVMWPRGLVFHPNQDFADFWVNDTGRKNKRLVLFDHSGNMIRVIGQNTFDQATETPEGVDYANDGRIWQADGEIGLDRDGNLYLSEFDLKPRTVRFSSDVPEPNQSYLHSSDGKFLTHEDLQRHEWNYISGDRVSDWYGFSVFGDQFFASDKKRILVWNGLSGIENGAHADYVVGQENFNTKSPAHFFLDSAGKQSIDKNNKTLWIASRNDLFALTLPITENIENIEGQDNSPFINQSLSSNSIFWADGSQTIKFNVSAIVIDPISQDTLWLADNQRNRVLRIVDIYSSRPKVNLVIGQPSKADTDCNFEGRSARSLCNPGDLKFDNHGNLYITEGVYEARDDMPGNKRIIEFDRITLDNAISQGIFSLPVADRVYTKPDFETYQALPSRERQGSSVPRPNNPIAVNFDRENRMYVVVDSYYNKQNERVFVYKDPLRNKGYVEFSAELGDKVIPVPMGQGAEIQFDDQDNLWIQDHTWNRILKLDVPLYSHDPRDIQVNLIEDSRQLKITQNTTRSGSTPVKTKLIIQNNRYDIQANPLQIDSYELSTSNSNVGITTADQEATYPCNSSHPLKREEFCEIPVYISYQDCGQTDVDLKLNTNAGLFNTKIPIVVEGDIKPWKDGISAGWVGQSGALNIMSGKYLWKKYPDGRWESLGSIVGTNPSNPFKGLVDKKIADVNFPVPWDYGNITGAWLGLSGNLNIIVEDRMWRRSQGDWIYLGQINGDDQENSYANWDMNPFKLLSAASDISVYPWNSDENNDGIADGVTGLWLGTSGKLNVMSNKRMWKRDKVDGNWKWIYLGDIGDCGTLTKPCDERNPFRNLASDVTKEKPWGYLKGVTALWLETIEESGEHKSVLNVASEGKLWKRIGGTWQSQVSIEEIWSNLPGSCR